MEQLKGQETGPRTEDFNEHHPELQDGEIFVTNCLDGFDGEETETAEQVFNNLAWRTKRRGMVAYGRDGKRLSGGFPAFAKRSEREDAGANPDRL